MRTPSCPPRAERPKLDSAGCGAPRFSPFAPAFSSLAARLTLPLIWSVVLPFVVTGALGMIAAGCSLPGGSIGESGGAAGHVGAATGGHGAGGASPGGGGGAPGGTVAGEGTGGANGGVGSGGTGGRAVGSVATGGVNGGTGGSGANGVRGGASGTGGGTGTGGGSSGAPGGGDMACRSQSPPAPVAGVHFPYPQHRLSASCLYPPSCSDADAMTGWQKYKARLVVSDGKGDGSLRVQRPENSNDTVSEGIGYGMLFAVYFDDRVTFDGIWKYAQKFFDGNSLMNWRIDASGNVSGQNSATDSDEDMAFALVMADKQWGGYTAAATGMVNNVANHDFQTDGTVRGGDTYDSVNPSYLAPAFYRVFGTYTGNARWNTIIEKSYQILAGAANGTTGLVPDWTDGHGPDYTYDAARTPFRISLDACWNNEPRATSYAQKIGGFFAGVGAANIRDGYQLSGNVTGTNKNSTFIGPAGVAGMAAKQAQLVADAYTQVATDVTAGTESYYNLSWALFTALEMTGNFVNFAAPP